MYLSPSSPPDKIENSDVAKSAGLAFLGRLGALVEIIGLPLMAWLYGAATLGIFFTLWSATKLATTFTECAMTTSLQRFQPRATTDGEKRQIIKIAILTGLAISLTLSTIIYIYADLLAEIFNASADDAAKLPGVIKIYIWVLPLWTMVEILTASVRAERKFGPEIRIRIFYEQGLRILGGVIFYYLGYQTFGLFFAHIGSVLIAAILSLHLLSKFHNLRAIFSQKIDGKKFSEILSFSIFMMPANMIKRAHSEVPIIVLNLILPGAQGAQAAAIFGVGRKITSLLQVVRMSFEYIVAPFASHKLSHETHDDLEDMYGFSARLIASIILPLGALLIVIRGDILALFSSDFKAAAGVILILAIGRIIEALTGPANSIIEMVGHKAWPLFNGMAGLTALLGLQFLLTDTLGVLAGAIGAAVGLSLTAILSLIEGALIYNLLPYRPSGFIRPVALAFITSLLLTRIIPLFATFGHAVSIMAALLGLMAAFFIIIRYGFSERDVKTLGRLGKWFRGK